MKRISFYALLSAGAGAHEFERSAEGLALARISGKMSPMEEMNRGPFPRVNDHLVVPEVRRDEIIGRRRVVVQPAKPESLSWLFP